MPPKKDAVLSNNSISVSSYRDHHIAEIWSKERSEWKRQPGYYLLGHAENAFYRHKRIIGGRLRAKNDDAQKLDATIGCAILNRMFEMCRTFSDQADLPGCSGSSKKMDNETQGLSYDILSTNDLF